MHKTGATRHKKFLKAEKSKTKLKGKKDKELPKGTNVTKTNFKVKKIVIKEQLKKHTQTEALSTRKLNVKELLSRLNHFNAQSRTDALDGLKEIIISNPEILEQSLGSVIHGVSALVLNVEKTVRQAALKVLHLVLSNIETEKLEPFFEIMSTYLRSAMTHIDNRIQDDSLLFLDILLVCTPEKCAEHFYKIIPNFLDMISKLRTDAKPGRSLTVNLNSQITSVKWRVKVLDRLKGFLHQFAVLNKVTIIKQCNDTKIKRYNLDGSNYFPLFNPMYTSISQMCFLTSKCSENVEQVDEVDKFKEYVEILMPLLFETWLEASPRARSDSRMETVLSEEAALLLRHILEAIITIWELTEFYHKKAPSSNIEDLFCKKFKVLFTQNVCNSFPYVTNIRSKQGKSFDNNIENVNLDPKLTAENLHICFLYIVLNPQINIAQDVAQINNVLGYLVKVLSSKLNENITKLMFKILNKIFSNKNMGWIKTKSVESLFNRIIEISLSKGENNIHQKTFALLCGIAMDDKLSFFNSNEYFEKWLKNLPSILLGKSLTTKTVDIIHKFAVTKNSLFNSVMKSKLLNIITNLPKLSIDDSTDNTSYYKLYSVLYWVKVWDTDCLNLLENQLLNNEYRSDHGKYIFDTLRLKSGGIL